MTFQQFQSQVSDGIHIIIDGTECVVLQSTSGVVVARPEGTPIYHGDYSAGVQVVCLTSNSYPQHEVSIC